jgi:hypothetical protein
VISPRRVLAKRSENVKRKLENIKTKKIKTAPKVSGSTKYISPARIPQRNIVTSKVGKKFLRFKLYLDRGTSITHYSINSASNSHLFKLE